MKIGIEIVCRHNSTRFKGKILYKINGKTVLDTIVDRIKQKLPCHPIVVATSNENSDDIIFEHCHERGLDVFRGDLDDVGGRLLKCAKHYKWDYFVRINGDNIFVDVESLKEMSKNAIQNKLNFVTNVPSRTFPFGMSVEILNTGFYEDIYESGKLTKEDKEHVTRWLYSNLNAGSFIEYKNDRYKHINGKKLALDSREDLCLINDIVRFTDKPITDETLKDIDNFFRVHKNY